MSFQQLYLLLILPMSELYALQLSLLKNTLQLDKENDAWLEGPQLSVEGKKVFRVVEHKFKRLDLFNS